MGYDFKHSQGKRKVLETLRSEAFKEKFPYGATPGEVAHVMHLSAGYVSETLRYLRASGLVVEDKAKRNMAADSETAKQPFKGFTLDGEALERVRAGLPSTGVLTPYQQQKLEACRKKHA